MRREMGGRVVSVATEPVLGVAKEMRSVLAFGQRVLEGSGLGPDTCDFMFGTPRNGRMGRSRNVSGSWRAAARR